MALVSVTISYVRTVSCHSDQVWYVGSLSHVTFQLTLPQSRTHMHIPAQTCPCAHSTVSRPVVRLVGGNTASEGRVEVYYSDTWGTVCQNDWTVQDANVVCRELGYPRALAAPGYSTFGAGTGQVL